MNFNIQFNTWASLNLIDEKLWVLDEDKMAMASELNVDRLGFNHGLQCLRIYFK